METYQQQKDTILRLFHQLITLSKKQGRNDLAMHLVQEATHLQKGQLCVVVAGEFKQGKSSLIDALLDEPGLFPDNPDIATSLISTISYAPEEKVTVMMQEDGQHPAPKNIRREEIPDYVMEGRNPKNVRNARMLMIESPNQRLKDGLVLVDTPGTGGLFQRHSEVTYAFLHNADAVLYVSDVLSPLSVKDLEFVQKIAGQCQRIAFVMTKTDLSSQENYQSVLGGNRAKLANALNRASDEIHIVPVSSIFKLNYLESQDPDDLADSNFAALERELWDILQQRSDILLNRALFVLSQAITEVQVPLEAEREALLHSPRVEEMKQQLLAARERMRQLESNKSEWRFQLQQGVRSIREKMMYQFQNDAIGLRKNLDGYLDKADLLQTPSTILNMVEQDIYQMMNSLDTMLQDQVAWLHERIQQSTGLGLSPVAVTIQNYTKPVSASNVQVEVISEKKLSWWDKLMIGMSRGTAESRGAATVGSIVGGAIGLGVDIFTLGATGGGGLLVGAWLGGQVGKIAGYKSGIARGLDQMKAQNLAEARHKIEKQAMLFIEQSKVPCIQTMTEAIDRMESDMLREFNGFIDRERTESEAVLRTVSDAQKLSQEDADRRLQEMAPLLEWLKRFAATIQQIAQQVALNAEFSGANGGSGNG